MAKPDVYSYITLANKKGADELLKRAGYPKPKNPKEMADMLANLVVREGENALIELSKIHPDRELILKAKEALEPVKNADAGQDSENLNCSGCAAALALAADAKQTQSSPAPAKKILSEKTINILIVSGAAVLAASLITLIVVSKNK